MPGTFRRDGLSHRPDANGDCGAGRAAPGSRGINGQLARREGTMNALSTVIPIGRPCAAPALSEDVLQIRNLTHTYGNGVKALADVSLDIPRGMYGLLGPNGAGKSTLMRSIATLQKVDAGSMHFGDIDIQAQPDRAREA